MKVTMTAIAVLLVAVVSAQDVLDLRMEGWTGREPTESVILLGTDIGLDVWGHEIGAKSEQWRVGPCWVLPERQRVSLLVSWVPEADKFWLNPTWSSNKPILGADESFVGVDVKVPLNSGSSWSLYSPETRFLWKMGDSRLSLGVSAPWTWSEGSAPVLKIGLALKYKGDGYNVYGRVIENTRAGPR